MQTAKRPRALGLIVAFLVIVLFVTVYTFVLQLNYSNMAVDAAVAWDTRCADAIHLVPVVEVLEPVAEAARTG